MFNTMGYFTYRDVYPMTPIGESTRGRTKVESSSMEAPVETRENNEDKTQIIDNMNVMGIAKFFVGIIVVMYLVSKFGK